MNIITYTILEQGIYYVNSKESITTTSVVNKTISIGKLLGFMLLIFLAAIFIRVIIVIGLVYCVGCVVYCTIELWSRFTSQLKEVTDKVTTPVD